MQPTFVRPFWGIVVVMLAVALSGCATLFSRPLQQVPVASAPPRAEVFVDGTLAGRTPLTLELERHSEHEVLVRLGDRELTVTLRSGLDTVFVALDVAPGLVMAGVSALVLFNSPDRTFEPSGPMYLPDINPLIRSAAGIGIAIGLGSAAIKAGVDASSGRWYRLTPGEVLVVFD
jgi:hypothetical protein